MIRPKVFLSRLLLLTLCSLLLAGCGSKVPGTPVKSPPSRPISLISPIDFFPPEQKRLSQHLDWHTGCFKVEYAGPHVQLASRTELWVNGKPHSGTHDSASVQAGMNEISISVRDDANPRNYHVQQVLSSAGGHAGGMSSYTKPDLGSWSTSVAKLPGSTELKPGEEVTVWAFMLFKRKSGESYSSPTANEPILDQVKRSDWALVLKVTLDPPKR